MYTWVSTEFRRQGTPPSTRNSPVDTEFRLFFLLAHIQYAMLCYLFSSQLWRNSLEFCGIPRNFADFKSQSLHYVWILVFLM
jgi:hypothetical protein